jgi:hypothetical protein
MTRWEAWKAKRAALGICIDCPSPPIAHGYCQSCIVRRRKYHEIKRKANPKSVNASNSRHRARLRSMGLCPVCATPCEPYDRCEYHRKKQADYMYKKRAKFTPRRAQRNFISKQRTLDILKNNEPILRANWSEAEAFIKEHIELFRNKQDRILFDSMPLFEEHDAIDESTTF